MSNVHGLPRDVWRRHTLCGVVALWRTRISSLKVWIQRILICQNHAIARRFTIDVNANDLWHLGPFSHLKHEVMKFNAVSWNISVISRPKPHDQINKILIMILWTSIHAVRAQWHTIRQVGRDQLNQPSIIQRLSIISHLVSWQVSYSFGPTRWSSGVKTKWRFRDRTCPPILRARYSWVDGPGCLKSDAVYGCSCFQSLVHLKQTGLHVHADRRYAACNWLLLTEVLTVCYSSVKGRLVTLRHWINIANIG